MTNNKPPLRPPLRFDHREIAVIFSLFIFVCLLMFTVGILVGKGLTQAKYEGSIFLDGARERRSHGEPAPESVSFGTPPASNPEPAPEKPEVAKLTPQKSRMPGLTSPSLHEPTRSKTADNILRNPKVAALIDDGEPHRTVASLPSPSQEHSQSLAPPKTLPPSFPNGKFTVEVGSYPKQKEAADRVEELKKLGFPHAYFSVKEVGESKDNWYGVWLGYYPDHESAQGSGQMLQERGEVKSYLVRKTESNGSED
jgi:hypothetical protein